ncbi:MAG TPA: PaaI family thioesterase [Caulobacteraceae bacterium]|nr:PaaI family thioesterase [Caulobacteraceae bacterium]
MARWDVCLSADELNEVLSAAFPTGGRKLDLVREVSAGRVKLVRAFEPAMLRPGGTIAGPVLMNLADAAAYVLVMAHVGAELMAMTSSLTMHFLRPAKPGELHVDGELLSLGRRSAVCDVRIWTESPDRLAAQATVTYARAAAA